MAAKRKKAVGVKLYAIYAGAGGFKGVVKGSVRARELTQGVAGAKQCACDTREQAERFINFHIRRAGVRGWGFEDIEAAAAEPIEVQEGAAEAKADAQEEPYGQAFWESAPGCLSGLSWKRKEEPPRKGTSAGIDREAGHLQREICCPGASDPGEGKPKHLPQCTWNLLQ